MMPSCNRAGTTAAARFKAALADIFSPRERLSPSQWVETFLFLPPGHESKPGRICFDETPYLREPLDALDDPSVQDCVLVAPTRTGKTLMLRAGALFGVAGDPAPAIWVNDTVDNARAVSETELQPVINFNAALRDRKPRDRHKFGNLKMLFPGASLYLTGANSPGNVAGKTVARVWGNEVDKWLGATDKEAGVVDLVRHRTGSFEGERKHFFVSTPTTEHGQIWIWFLKGDQRKWHIGCAACGGTHAMAFDHVKWDQSARDEDGEWIIEAAAASARYVCPHCLHAHTQAELDAVKRLGFWLASASPKLPGVRSYQLCGLAGPWRENSMGEMVTAFIASRSSGWIADRQDFWNSRMGLPWVDEIASLTLEKLAHLCEKYSRGFPPEGFKPDVTLLSYDVQTWGLPWIVRVFSWDGTCYLLDHGVAAGWADLDATQKTYTANFVIGDSNFEERRAEQMEQTYRRAHVGWILAEGFDTTKDGFRLVQTNAFAGGKQAALGAMVQKLVVSLYEFKVELEKRLKGEVKNWKCYTATPGDASSAKELAEYFTQLLDERRVPRKRLIKGKPPCEFKKRTGNNHFFDCEVYALALFRFLQMAHTTARDRAVKKAATPSRIAGSIG